MSRYIVHGLESGEMVRKVFEASSGDEARGMAEAIGLEVRAIEVDDGAQSAHGGDDPFSSAAPDDPRTRPEETVWKGTTSQWVNFGWFIGIVTIPYALWRMLVVKSAVFELTTQRIRYRHGVLSQTVDEIELYRVKDTELTKSVMDRILGLGTVTVISSDETVPRLPFRSVPNPDEVREMVRQHVEAVRRARGVRELDVS